MEELSRKERQLKDFKQSFQSKMEISKEDFILEDVKAELKMEQKYRSALKALEMKVVEHQSENNTLASKTYQLKLRETQLENLIATLESKIKLLREKQNEEIKKAGKIFQNEFKQMDEKIQELKNEVEQGREFKIKFEFLNKDYQGKQILVS